MQKAGRQTSEHQFPPTHPNFTSYRHRTLHTILFIFVLTRLLNLAVSYAMKTEKDLPYRQRRECATIHATNGE